jgi:hypothetical protein
LIGCDGYGLEQLIDIRVILGTVPGAVGAENNSFAHFYPPFDRSTLRYSSEGFAQNGRK